MGFNLEWELVLNLDPQWNKETERRLNLLSNHRFVWKPFWQPTAENSHFRFHFQAKSLPGDPCNQSVQEISQFELFSLEYKVHVRLEWPLVQKETVQMPSYALYFSPFWHTVRMIDQPDVEKDVSVSSGAQGTTWLNPVFSFYLLLWTCKTCVNSLDLQQVCCTLCRRFFFQRVQFLVIVIKLDVSAGILNMAAAASCGTFLRNPDV